MPPRKRLKTTSSCLQGNPKGVMYSHRSCCLETLLMMSGASSVLPVVPMLHVLAWCTPFSALCLGYKYVLYNWFRAPADFMDMLTEEQVDLFLGVLTVLNGIKMACGKAKYGGKLNAYMQRAVCGGSAPSQLGVEVCLNLLICVFAPRRSTASCATPSSETFSSRRASASVAMGQHDAEP